jgi:hypothetical protein
MAKPYQEPDFDAIETQLRGGGAPAGPMTPPLVPAYPQQKEADIPAAKARVAAAGEERFALGHPSDEAAFRGMELADAAAPTPDPVSEDFVDQLARSFLPQVVTRDGRPPTAIERAKAAAENAPTLARQMAFPAVDLARWGFETGRDIAEPNRDHPSYIKTGDPSRNPATPDDDLGTPTENGALYLMRVLGTAAEAVVLEGAERIPAPDVQAAVNEPTWTGAAAKYFSTIGESTMGEQYLGFSPDDDQRVPGYLRGVLERIETGSGLETDLGEGFRRKLGDGWENSGWALGLALSVVTDWEGALVAGPKAVARVRRSAAALKSLVPAGETLPINLDLEAVKGNELSAADYLGDMSAEAVESGRMAPANLPEAIQAYADQAAQNVEGMSFRELAAVEGFDRLPDLADPGFAAARAELAAATAGAGEAARVAAAQRKLLDYSAEQAKVAKAATSAATRAELYSAQAARSAEDARANIEKAKLGAKETAQAGVAAARARVEEAVKAAKAAPAKTPEAKEAKAAVTSAREALVLAQQRVKVAVEEVENGVAELEDAAAKASRKAENAARVAVAKETAAQEAAAAAKAGVGVAPVPGGTPGLDPGAFELRRVRDATGKSVERPKLPPGEGIVYNAADFWRQVTAIYKRARTDGVLSPIGYHINRGEGFRRMADALQQSVDDPVYTLRSRLGDVVEQGVGSLEQVTALMLKRSLDGDEVWYGTRRPVYRWRKVVDEASQASKPAIGADYFFASDVERRLAVLLRKSDPRANPVRLRSTVPAPLKPTPGQTIGAALARTVTGGPPAAAVRPSSRTAEVIREAYRLAIRDRLGTDRLKMLPTGAMVPLEDHKLILARAAELVGLSSTQAFEFVAGRLQLSEAQVESMRRLVPTFDPGIPDKAARAGAYEAARLAAIRSVAPAFADARYRIQGVRPLMERMLGAFKDAGLKRFKADRWFERGAIGWFVTGFSERFMRDALDRMPPTVRTAWKKLGLQIGQLADELAREIRGTADPEEALRATMMRSGIPHREELDMAARALDANVDPLKVRDEVRTRWTGTDRPTWLDHEDDLIVRAGLRRWAWATRGRAASIAREYLLVNFAVAGQKVDADSALYDAVMKLPDEDMFPLFEEIGHRGDVAGPILRAAFEQRFPGKALPDTQEVLIAFALHLRAKSRMGEAFERMVRQGMAVRRSDPRVPTLEAVMNGSERTWNEAAQRWDYHYTSAQVEWARNRLRDWGIEPGAGGTLVDAKGNSTGVLVPAFLRDEVARLFEVGVVSSREMTGYQAANRLFRLFKEAHTHGILLPNPSHFLGQALGVLPALATNQGLGGATSALGTLMYRHPGLVGSLTRRLGGKGFPEFLSRSPDADLLRTVDGSVHFVDELERVARDFQLGETRTDFEVADSLREVLVHEDAGPLQWRRIKTGAAWWQSQIRDFAGAFDMNARLAVYVDLVRQGKPLEEAALEARQAVLDFRDLTPYESKYLRLVFTFYAFMRKNADSYMRALLLHPARVLGQMRLAHGSLTSSGLTDVELGGMTDADSARMTVYEDREVVSEEGRPHPAYRLNRVASSPLGVAEWLGTMRMILPIPGSGPDTQALLQSVNPLAQAIAIPLQGRRLETTFERAWANRIPPVLLDLPWGGDMLADAVGAGWEPLTATDDPLVADDDATLEAGAPAYWSAGSPSTTASPAARKTQRLLWQEFLVFFGRPMRETEALAEAIGLDETPPNVTQSEAAFDYLTGFKHRPVLNEEHVKRRRRAKLEAELGAVANEVRPPEDVGPR